MNVEAIVLGLFVAIPATIAAIASLVNASHSKRARAEFLDIVDDGNGGRKIGRVVHDILQSVEFLAAQTHTNTAELLSIAAKLDQHVETEHGQEGDPAPARTEEA